MVLTAKAYGKKPFHLRFFVRKISRLQIMADVNGATGKGRNCKTTNMAGQNRISGGRIVANSRSAFESIRGRQLYKRVQIELSDVGII